MKFWVLTVAAVLLTASGCGSLDPTRRPARDVGEERHPSNAMTPAENPPEPARKEPSKVAKAKRPKPARRPPALEDPRKIPSGIDYSEMVRRFGPPNMRVTDSPTRTTFSYSRPKTQVQVEVQNGKVVSVAAVNTGF